MPSGVYERSPEVRRAASERMKGRKRGPHTDETRRKMSEAAKGRKHTDETRRKLSEAHRNKPRGPLSEETKRKISEAVRGKTKGRKHTDEAKQKISAAQRGKTNDGRPAAGHCFKGGYKYLSGQQEHPLVSNVATGQVLEHRKVLYDEIGPGPHECYWNQVSGCGKTDLEWGGRSGIQADHLDGDKLNNVVTNLVPSCVGCNRRRAAAGNPIDWDGQNRDRNR